MTVSINQIGDRSDLTYRALADPNRRHLLRLLDDAERPLEVDTLSVQVGLHPNTVREHLELLAQAGLVTRAPEKRTRPGRPKMLYEAAPRDTRSPESEGYRFLAEVLASYIEATVPDPAAAAEEAGRVWGHYMVDRPAPFAQPDTSYVVEQIVTTLAGLGFAPEEGRHEKRIVIRLHDCPFRDVARNRGDVVCSVHLGILRGMAEELGGWLSVDDLRPFVEPSLCVANLSINE
ncbi:MAG TPA: helix-turn-helix domain-containing protein [Acidimicrobiia bacterium]